MDDGHDQALPLTSRSDESAEDGTAKEAAAATILTRTLGSHVFHMRVMVEQTFIHMLAPLSTVFLHLCGCGQLAKNLRLSILPCCSPLTGGLAELDNIALLLNMILFYCNRETFLDAGIQDTQVVWYPAAGILMQRLMVSLKYAMLTDEEYAIFKQAPEDKAHEWMNNLQLLSGWVPLLNDLLEAEMDLSSAIAGTDIGTCSFVHEIYDDESAEAWRVWECLIKDEYPSDGQGPRRCSQVIASCKRVRGFDFGLDDAPRGAVPMPAKTVLRRLIQVARDNAPRLSMPVSLCIGLTYSLIPVFLGLWSNGKFDCPWTLTGVLECTRHNAHVSLGGSNPIVNYSVVMAILLMTKYCSIGNAFLSVGVIHFKRVKLLLKHLCELARPVADDAPNLPQLQLEGSHAVQNTMSLMLCYEVALRFGLRYQQRLRAYIGVVMVMSAVFLLALYLQVGDRAAHQRQDVDLARSSSVSAFADLRASALYLLYGTSICCFYGIIMVLSGAIANEFFARLRKHLNSRRWRYLLNRLEKPRGKAASQEAPTGDEEKSQTAFDLALAKLEVLEAVDFVEVGGFKASAGLASGLLWTIAPALGVIVGRLYFPGLLAV